MKNKLAYFQNQSFSENAPSNEIEEIDLEKTAEMLVKCGNNRPQFQSYINRINSLILGDENLDSIGKQKKVEQQHQYEPTNSFYKSKINVK